MSPTMLETVAPMHRPDWAMTADCYAVSATHWNWFTGLWMVNSECGKGLTLRGHELSTAMRIVTKEHKAIVKDAIKRGLPVPADVRAEYEL